MKYGDSVWYRSRTLTTDMPNPNHLGEYDWILKLAKQNDKNILVLQNAFEKTRKQMKVNALSINALCDNLNFQMFAKLTLKKT